MQLLRYIIAKLIFAPRRQNWYELKGYSGRNDQEYFAAFMQSQRQEGARLYEAFQGVDLERFRLPSGNYQLDALRAKPQKTKVKKVIICFNGRKEYYEKRFKDIALIAKLTQVEVIGFNPRGVNSSPSRTLSISDYVADGIAALEYVMQQGWQPNQIILYGNSLGAAAAEMVTEYFRQHKQYEFRQITSNTYSTLSRVIVDFINMPFLNSFFSYLLKYFDWEISPGSNYYSIGVHRMYLRRLHDGIIVVPAQYYKSLDIEADIAKAPDNFKTTLQWLCEHASLTYVGPELEHQRVEPHKMSLNYFRSVPKGHNGEMVSPFELIRRFCDYN